MCIRDRHGKGRAWFGAALFGSAPYLPSVFRWQEDAGRRPGSVLALGLSDDPDPGPARQGVAGEDPRAVDQGLAVGFLVLGLHLGPVTADMAPQQHERDHFPFG